MIADTTTYVVSLIKVFSGATFLIIVLPMLVWHNYLKSKKYSYRFVFCVITQNCFLINLVLLLGFFKICNVTTVTIGIILMSVFVLWSFSDKQLFSRSATRLKVLKQVVNGERKLSSVWRDIGKLFLKQLHTFFRWPIWKNIGKNLFDYVALGTAVVYNIWFLSYDVIKYHCYQFSDIPVHQSWIYQLDHGVLFGSGIYPFGMHSIVYLIHNLFNLDLREVLLYFGVFQTILLLISVYLLSKKIFRWKYSSIIVLISFSLFLNQGRYAAALPEECGMFAVALAAYCLISFLNTPLEKRVIHRDTKLKRFFRINQYFTRIYMKTDVLLFMLTVALTIEYHFYTAIAALMLIFAVLFSYIVKIVKKQYWVPVFMAGILGTIIAVAPLAACYAEGIPLQESLQWAISVMKGEQWNYGVSDSDYQKQLDISLGNTAKQDQTAVTNNGEKTDNSQQKLTLQEKIKTYYEALYSFSDAHLYGGTLTKIFVICIGLGFCCAVIFLFFVKTRPTGFNYISIILYIIIMCTMGAAQILHIVEIVEYSRASSFAEPFIGIIYAIPMDFIFGVLVLYQNKIYQVMLSMISIALCIMVVVFIFQQGWVHKFLNDNITYYNESEYLTRNIKDTYKKNTFTIVSTTDEYYEVVDYGYHSNISQFMNMVNGKEAEFKIPTQYVFFFIEKRVLNDHYYGNIDVSTDLASKKFVYFASTWDYQYQRAVLESQAYYWALAFMKMYPNSFKIYYEDDVYVAFVLEQNPYSLYNFQIDYLSGKENSK